MFAHFCPFSNVCNLFQDSGAGSSSKGMPPLRPAGIFNTPTSKRFAGKFRGFAEEDHMVETVIARYNTAVGAVAFKNVDPVTGVLGSDMSYSIRFSQWTVPSSEKIGLTDSILSYRNAAGNDDYIFSSFVPLQDAVDRAFASLAAQSYDLLWMAAPFVQPFPIPAHATDSFSQGFAAMVPLLMVLSWVYSVALTTKDIVLEKEKRLKEAMKMMGLNAGLHWVGWFLTALVILTVSCILMTIIISTGGIFPQSNGFLLFIVIELFAISSITFSFLISTFFSKAKVCTLLLPCTFSSACLRRSLARCCWRTKSALFATQYELVLRTHQRVERRSMLTGLFLHMWVNRLPRLAQGWSISCATYPTSFSQGTTICLFTCLCRPNALCHLYVLANH